MQAYSRNIRIVFVSADDRLNRLLWTVVAVLRGPGAATPSCAGSPPRLIASISRRRGGRWRARAALECGFHPADTLLSGRAPGLRERAGWLPRGVAQRGQRLRAREGPVPAAAGIRPGG